MAEQNNLLAALREAVALYDDDALSALANKGLLRRAVKDLESSSPTFLDEMDGVVRIDAGEAIVSLALPLQSSRCACPASGICRHILLALLWLKRAAPEPAASAAPAAGEEIRALTAETIQRWAGKPILRKAMKLLAHGHTITWQEGATLDFAFPDQQLTCRWLPGHGMEGMICACHAPQICEHRVMAILAYRSAHGLDDIIPDIATSSQETSDRIAVLRQIRIALNELLGHGLSRLSPASHERIFSMAVSAHGADLPRMERLLKTLATEIALQLARDAQADAGNLLTAAARIEALRLALRNPTPALCGQHRSEYYDVQSLSLLGMGATQWRTKSNFVGLTVYFWDVQHAQWMSWSDARPAASPDGFSPAKRLLAPGPWPGCASPAAVHRQGLTLRNARRNAAGRISGRQETVAEVNDAGVAGAPSPISSWDVIAERAITLFSAGFQDWDERDALLYVEPAKWGTPSFQEINQELVLPLQDTRGSSFPIIVPYSTETTDAIVLLESLKWTSGTRVLGSLRFRECGVYLEPLVIYQREKTINLTLDKHQQQSSLVEKIASYFTRPRTATVVAPPPTSIGTLLEAALAEVEIIAEGGVSAHYDTTRLQELAARCAEAGLTLAAANITQIVTALATMRHTMTPDPMPAAQSVLRGYYVLRQSRLMDSLLQATAGLR